MLHQAKSKGIRQAGVDEADGRCLRHAGNHSQLPSTTKSFFIETSNSRALDPGLSRIFLGETERGQWGLRVE